MSKVTQFMFTVYSTKPIPREIRGTFQLPKYPFKDGGLPSETKKLFLDLGIVHYRDELTPQAMLCIPEDMDTRGFPAYRTSGVLAYNGMKIDRWTDTEDKIKYEKLVRHKGDDFAWMGWNMPVIILEMNDNEVKLG